MKPKLYQKSNDGVLSPLAAAKFLEGEIALQEGDTKRAVDAYQTALAMDSQNLFLMTSLAAAYWQDGSGEKAEEMLGEVLEKNPSFEFALNLCGTFQREKGNLPLAEDYFKKAVSQAPSAQEGYLNLIDLYESSGNLTAAFETAETLIQKIPALADGYALSANLAFSLGMIETSHERTLQYIDLIPLDEKEDRFKILLKQGQNMLEAGREDYALFLLKTYLDIFPDDAHAIASLVSVLAKLGKTSEARHLAAGLKDDSLMLKAQLLYETGAYRQALDVIGKLYPDNKVTDLPAAAKIIKTVGWAYEMNFKEARKWLSLFEKDELESRAEAVSKLTGLLLSSGMEEEAFSILTGDPSTNRAIENFEVLHALSVELSDGKLKKRKKELALALGPHQAAELLVRWSGFLNGNESDITWLKENIDTVIATSTSNRLVKTARICKAVLFGEKIVKANQTELLDLIVKIKGEEPESAMIPLLQARFFFLIGNSERAAVWFEKAESHNPSDLITKLWHAELLMKEGKTSKADSLLHSALQLNPPLYFLKRIVGLME